MIEQPDKPAAPAAVPWTPRDVAWGMAAFVGWIVLVVAASEAGRWLNLNIDPGVTVVFGTALLLLPAWYFTVYKYGVSWAELGLRGFQPAAVGLGCGLMIASVIFNMLYAAFLALFNLQIQPNIDEMFNLTDFPVALLFGGVVVAPIVEEVFFRGFIFAGLRRRWDWKIAAAISALMFAVAHVLPTSFLPIFILGVIFAGLYQFSGSIWPAILMHMLTNAVALSVAYALSQGWVPPS